MKRYQTYLVAMTLAAAMLSGCGAQENQESSAENSVQSSVESSVESSSAETVESSETSSEAESSDSETAVSENGAAEVLNKVWNGFAEENQFPSFGGSISNPADNAAGAIDAGDTDTLSYTLLLPEELQGQVTEAASLLHMMNANTFTGAALKVDAANQDAFVATLKDTIMNNQFMCGMPEKLVIVTSGDYVVYAFGVLDFIDEFEKSATANLGGATVQVSELF